MRINQFLAKCGFGSRRSTEVLIDEGKVSVDGIISLDKSTRIDPSSNIVKVGDVLAKLKNEEAETWIFNKPAGYLCSREDPTGKKTIFECLKHLPPPYQAVGRLDMNTRGLLIISRNGDLANTLMHPRFEVKKRYKVIVQGDWKENFIQRLSMGVQMREGGYGHMAVIEYKNISTTNHELHLELKQGKKREIRYSLTALGLSVVDLQRIQIEFLNLAGLKEGKSRALTSEESSELQILQEKLHSNLK